MVDWVYDEVVLAADLVSRRDWSGQRATTREVEELSELLRVGALHGDVALPSNFRSPSSIQRKTFDIATLHPAYKGKPTRGGSLDGSVLEAFLEDTPGMQARAKVIRQLLAVGERIPADHGFDEFDYGREGRLVEYVARRRERDRGLRDRKVRSLQAQGVNLACEVCGFDFGAFYGNRGQGYIEVHHVTPLHVSEEVTTSLNDLAALCANCHRMCHRGGWITPGTLASLVAERPVA